MPSPTYQHPVIIIAGVTAGGKSASAMQVAKALDGIIINADSMQIYGELSILTARPASHHMEAVPHALYGVLRGAETCSVGRWLSMVHEVIIQAHAAGKIPIVTGGTGLYIKALMQGLSPIPHIPPATRARVQARYDANPNEAFAYLVRVDKITARRLPVTDRQRVTRALEVWEATRIPFSTWLTGEHTHRLPNVRFIPVLIEHPRPIVHARIETRFAGMIEAGAVDEVMALRELSLPPAHPLMKAIGVAEINAHLAGTYTLQEACTRAVIASRHYAKRQATWFRHQLADAYRPVDGGADEGRDGNMDEAPLIDYLRGCLADTELLHGHCD